MTYPFQSSAIFQQFQSNWLDLVEDLLSTKFDPAVSEPCDCGIGELREYRCTDTGCLGAPVKCRECLLQAHKTAPFHWVQQWNGKFFERTGLFELGLSYTVGHSGESCPATGEDNTGLQLIVVDTNGIHSTRIHFCHCFGAPSRARQLMRSRLFPATIGRPAMAFTFSTLKQFHLHCFESKKSAFDYIGALRRMTNNARTEHVPVCAS